MQFWAQERPEDVSKCDGLPTDEGKLALRLGLFGPYQNILQNQTNKSTTFVEF